MEQSLPTHIQTHLSFADWSDFDPDMQVSWKLFNDSHGQPQFARVCLIDNVVTSSYYVHGRNILSGIVLRFDNQISAEAIHDMLHNYLELIERLIAIAHAIPNHLL